MHIKEIAIRNFRILSDSKIELNKEPCMMIGRNNADKTSFMVLMEKFLRGQSFTFTDFQSSGYSGYHRPKSVERNRLGSSETSCDG